MVTPRTPYRIVTTGKQRIIQGTGVTQWRTHTLNQLILLMIVKIGERDYYIK